MSVSSRFRPYWIVSIGLVLIGTFATTGWLLKPTWEAYREQTAFERAVQRARLDDDAAIVELSKLARQSGLPKFATAEIESGQAVLVPFYLRASWYCLYRVAEPSISLADASGKPSLTITRVYRLQIPLENYQPQTENARKLIDRVGQVDVQNTPSGPVEEPALPLHMEEARRVAFMWDFYELLTGRAHKQVRTHYDLIRSDPPDSTSIAVNGNSP